MKVLVIGSGGREHAMVRQIVLSAKVSRVYCAPGNAGMEGLCETTAIPVQNTELLVDFALKNQIDLTIVGPELPLTLGIVDAFEARGLKILGPSQKASVLEGSKSFTKDFCQKYNIPTAGYKSFNDASEAREYIKSNNRFPVVLKADGLAAGKGVVIAKDLEQANQAIQDMLVYEKFGEAGRCVVVEEFLQGQEASFIVLTDGHDFVCFAPSQDHKQIFDGDQGPNTGGMGAYAPAPVLTKSLQNKVIESVIKPTLKGMEQEGRPYRGFLYAGLMISPEGEVNLIEYNCRLGDPEAEVILPLMKTDFITLVEHTLEGTLSEVVAELHDKHAVCVVLSSEGYPAEYKKGFQISGLDQVVDEDVWVIHAGTKKTDDHFATAGGRVLVVTALGEDLTQAIKKAYQNVSLINWEGMYYRKDIAQKGLKS